MADKILFVDSEPYAHKALKRTFRDMRQAWDMRFASDPREAMAIMDEEPVEVLVTEILFAGQSGVEFLDQVRHRHPQAVRIIFSGYVDRDVILKSVDLAHQFLSKPCDEHELRDTLARAFLMKDLLDQEPLKRVVARIDSLPSLPALYRELVAELDSPDASIQKVGDIVEKDLALTAKLLKLVNSSFFGLPQHIASPARAVSMLGLDLVKSIVLASGTFDHFKRLKFRRFSVDRLWGHAMHTATLAKTIAELESQSHPATETAFMAGVLHDIGKLIIAAHLPDRFQAILQHMATTERGMADAERHVLGTTHAAVGAYLLGLWGLPDAIIQATAFHHALAPRPSDNLDAAVIVHVANAFANAGDALGESGRVLDDLDYPCLERIGCLPRIDGWRTGCWRKLQNGMVR